MQILLVEPFFTGSHQHWAQGLQKHSHHTIRILSLPGRFWKWRMHGAAVTLARQVNELTERPDLFIATDMLDVAVFRSLLKSSLVEIPVLLYFHENQITYPWSATDPDPGLQRDRHYGFINYTACLASDHIAFNSQYHLESFHAGLETYLKAMPDFQNVDTLPGIRQKSQVLYVGIDQDQIQLNSIPNKVPHILWNHRWEFDKQPGVFFQILMELAEEGFDFKLIVCGEHTHRVPTIFSEAKEQLKDQIVHFGHAVSREDYKDLLRLSDVLPVTSIQDFFGISIIEAIRAGVVPLLPDRLVYPEHIPEPLRPTFLYSSQSELKGRLKEFIINFPNVPVAQHLETLTNHILTYDWKQMIRDYDQLFEQLVS